jgi:threonine/homoserine/homoserine lactone efflux protein
LPNADLLIKFALTAFAIIVIPGPSVMFIVARGISLGKRAAVLSVLGNNLGAFVSVILVSIGIGPIIQRSQLAFILVSILGGSYLIYLGFKTIRDRNNKVVEILSKKNYAGYLQIVKEGFTVGALNPKTLVFFAAVLPQFVERGADDVPVPIQLLILGLIFWIIAFISDSTWGLSAGAARAWLATKPDRISNMTAMGGIVIMILGAGILLSLL